MSYKISQIEGIGEAYARKLEDAGIGTVEQLLDMCSGKKGRSRLAEETGISEKLKNGLTMPICSVSKVSPVSSQSFLMQPVLIP